MGKYLKYAKLLRFNRILPFGSHTQKGKFLWSCEKCGKSLRPQGIGRRRGERGSQGGLPGGPRARGSVATRGIARPLRWSRVGEELHADQRTGSDIWLRRDFLYIKALLVTLLSEHLTSTILFIMVRTVMFGLVSLRNKSPLSRGGETRLRKSLPWGEASLIWAFQSRPPSCRDWPFQKPPQSHGDSHRGLHLCCRKHQESSEFGSTYTILSMNTR